MTDDEKTFLVSVKSGQPNWEVMGIEGIENLPAIQWKLANILKVGAKKACRVAGEAKKNARIVGPDVEMIFAGNRIEGS